MEQLVLNNFSLKLYCVKNNNFQKIFIKYPSDTLNQLKIGIIYVNSRSILVLLHASFVQNHLTEGTAYNLFNIQRTCHHYPVGGPKRLQTRFSPPLSCAGTKRAKDKIPLSLLTRLFFYTIRLYHLYPQQKSGNLPKIKTSLAKRGGPPMTH